MLLSLKLKMLRGGKEASQSRCPEGEPSDHIIVTGVAPAHQIRQRNAVQIAVDGLIQPLPERQRAAFRRMGTGRCARFQTGYRGKRFFRQPQDLPCGVLFRRLRQSVAAALAADAAEQLGLDQ